jgi:hypothetical protein
MLPASLRTDLRQHLETVKRQHDADLAQGLGRVVLPDALDVKYPNAGRSWPWQFVFPAARICRDARWGPPSRFHLHESVIQRAVAGASRTAGLPKPSVATHCATPSPRTCWRMATTSGRSRNCWGTLTSPPR